MTKAGAGRRPRVPPEPRIDVTRIDYAEVRNLSLQNEAAIRRIQAELRVQFQRIAEIQAQLDSQRRPNRRSEKLPVTLPARQRQFAADRD